MKICTCTYIIFQLHFNYPIPVNDALIYTLYMYNSPHYTFQQEKSTKEAIKQFIVVLTCWHLSENFCGHEFLESLGVVARSGD